MFVEDPNDWIQKVGAAVPIMSGFHHSWGYVMLYHVISQIISTYFLNPMVVPIKSKAIVVPLLYNHYSPTPTIHNPSAPPRTDRGLLDWGWCNWQNPDGSHQIFTASP